jgi:hypothetical protein
MKVLVPFILVVSFATSHAVHAEQLAKTAYKFRSRFGSISVTTLVEGNNPDNILASRTFTVKHGNKILYIAEHCKLSLVDVEQLFRIKSKDVILISERPSIGNCKPNHYYFITFDRNTSKKSAEFVAPEASIIKIKQIGSKIEVKYPYHLKGLCEKLTRPPVVYENGDIVTGKKK